MTKQTLQEWKLENLSSDLLKAQQELKTLKHNHRNLVLDYRRELSNSMRLSQENEQLEEENEQLRTRNENLQGENGMLKRMTEKYDDCYTNEEYQDLAEYTRKLEEMLKNAKAKLENK
jgi:hypothetical protein